VGFNGGDAVQGTLGSLEISALTGAVGSSLTRGITAVDIKSSQASDPAVASAFGATDVDQSALASLSGAAGTITSFNNTADFSQFANHASQAVVYLDKGLSNLNVNRATVGAQINRLEHTVSNLMNVVQRTEEARSRIEDADFATESAALARANVLVQAGSAMLAQANQNPQYVLALLRS
jgi:flagellin